MPDVEAHARAEAHAREEAHATMAVEAHATMAMGGNISETEGEGESGAVL